MSRDDKIIQQLIKHANKANATVIDKGGGHFQIQGKLLVNYYPLSRRKTAYVDATVGGTQHVTPAQAVQMAMKPPPIVRHSERDKRQGSYRAVRKWLIRKFGAHCHWCNKPVTLDDSTVDHVIPIVRGGLDNRNNMVLACYECNQERGSGMPELKNGPKNIDTADTIGIDDYNRAVDFYSRNRGEQT